VSFTNMSFKAVWQENGICPGDKRHFKGAAREVYGYVRLLAKRHGGFVFATVPNITKHTKMWADKNGKSFSQAQCERILRAFRELGILGERCTRTIHHRKYSGWQFYEHDVWAESGGGMCEFKRWERYEKKYQYLMGNEKLKDFYLHDFQEENDGVNDGADDGDNDGIHDGTYDGESASNDGTNDGVNDGVPTIVSVPNTQQVNEMRAAKNP
jgi:hypothetical protein